MTFKTEKEFEDALINLLINEYKWEPEILLNYTEKELIQNWADILFANNREENRLNDTPLTEGEMEQILEQIRGLKTPFKLNSFINGGFVHIKRDNENDEEHFGKEVALKIYDRKEIAAGQSRYQIAEQPIFKTQSDILSDRRGDLTLLINGMPVIHIELKRSGIPVSQACNQIEKYSKEGVFTGLFSLVQVFVAMNPEKTLYFANPGQDKNFNPAFFFHWADFNNEPINDWQEVARTLLSIPMAHQLIGFYTIADASDSTLKVLRSYQYFAANAISDKVSKMDWSNNSQRGGYIWHTTGSGKTMTSFKSAQLIASSKDADKVIFLVDRIELGTQSLYEYRAFASDDEEVQSTENTGVLITKLKSDNPSDTLIVTSIQKMSNIKKGAEDVKDIDLKKINNKRIVFIVDECHRSTFGNMLSTIKETFPYAVFFGFTGTPIQEENKKKDSTTIDIFGDELHRYSIADGIRDKNVLGFDPYKVLTYKDKDLREQVIIQKTGINKIEDALNDPEKKKIYEEFMYVKPMAGYIDNDGNYIKGIEDYIPKSQYDTDEHKDMVVKDIKEQWKTLSMYGKFHALFATSSIVDAIKYYRLIKKEIPDMKVTALFDTNIDNNGTGIDKEEGLEEIIKDYNERYNQSYTSQTFFKMKKDIAARLAHKRPYEHINQNDDEKIDLLIVVDQMLTGFDSKWINTLYLDKSLKYESIIQAFSRTNRIFDDEKPFGTIRYYKFPHTMEKEIEKAVKLYSGDRPFGLFVDRLNKNLEHMNLIFKDIKDLFESDGIENFETLPEDMAEKKKFVSLFNEFKNYLEAAKIQGFTWDKDTYEGEDKTTGEIYNIKVDIDKATYYTLVQRYKEISHDSESGDEQDIPFDINGYITQIDTEKINEDYMNSRFQKFIKVLISNESDGNLKKKAEEELHKAFATLSQEDQKFANIFLHDIQSGNITLTEEKAFKDYINEYKADAEEKRIQTVIKIFDVNEEKLRSILGLNLNRNNINEFGRFDDLKETVNKLKAKEYFEKEAGEPLKMPKVNKKIDEFFRAFILEGKSIELPEYCT